MIARYDKEEISQIWAEYHKFELFLKVELAILEAQEDLNRIPKGIAKTISQKAKIDPERIAQIEQTVKHDIIAFSSSIAEQMEPNVGRFFHFGVTSSDIIDTALSLQIKESLDFIIPALKKLTLSIHQKAEEHKYTMTIGRSHGMFAEPMSLGQKWLGFFAELTRRLKDLENFYNDELTAQFSGAVGNYTIVTVEAEKLAAKKLGLRVEPLSTQVIPRDHIAKLISIHALLASAIERMATEIRHLHRSEVKEVTEGFTKGQKGSSIMPHKKNPISSENLTGISRILRSHIEVALNNIVLWHERDISHSSAERLYLPDNMGLTYYAVTRLENVINNLEIDTAKMEEHLYEDQSYLASYLMHFLLEHTALSREDSYAILQKASFTGKNYQEFCDEINKELNARKISVEIPLIKKEDIKTIYNREIDKMFKRVRPD